MSPRSALLRYPAMLWLLLALSGCAASQQRAAHPANIGELQQALIRYHDSGEYERQVAIVATRAADYMRAPALAPILPLARVVRASHVAVFFITGRFEDERAVTEANLRRAGYEGWEGLSMRATDSTAASAADFKAPARAHIAAQGFTILANIGDQPSDLAGGYAQRAFLLPNPFYRLP